LNAKRLFHDVLKWIPDVFSYKTIVAPSIFHFPLTYRCNGRCVMCNIWQVKPKVELGINEIETLLKNERVFRSITYVILTGGEPTLRKDLDLIVELLLKYCPDLESIGLTTNALLPKALLDHTIKCLELSNDYNVRFGISISLDGVGKIHDTIRGVKGAFSRVLESMSLLDSHGIPYGLHCVITKFNVSHLFEFKHWLKEQNLNCTFAIAEVRKRNLNIYSNFAITEKQIPILLKFLYQLTSENPTNYYYWMIYRMLRLDKPRSLPCPFAHEAFSIDPNGDIYYCTNSQKIGNIRKQSLTKIYYTHLNYQKQIRKQLCPTCLQDCMWRVAFRKTVKPVATIVTRKVTSRILRKAKK